MDLTNPGDWAQAAQGVKHAFEVLRGALQLVKEAKQALAAGGDGSEVDRALVEAEKATAIAETQLALALGYKLCRCTFPPTKMLTVGYRMPFGNSSTIEMIDECPACGISTAGAWKFTRTAPERRADCEA